MEPQAHLWDIAEKYVAGTLTDVEKVSLAMKRKEDPAFAQAFDHAAHLLGTMQAKSKTDAFRKTLSEIHTTAAQAAPHKPQAPRRTLPFKVNWRTVAVAASVAGVISLAGVLSNNTGSKDARYRQLSREIEAVKRSQNNLVQTQQQLLSEVKSAQHAVPSAPVNATGTAFALNNSGYLITAYHVAQDADSLYIQTRKGENYKASLLAFNPQADVAVLKIEDKSFRFAGGEIPYTFAPKKSGLGARIFTLGFPQDEVVYSEGYVSAFNGYRGDSAQYRLELPADPGVSGAPILDGSGNVVGIVAGRNNDLTGVTYAVGSPELLRLLRSMPKDIRPSLGTGNHLKGLSREQQLDKLQDYTCIVRVYKKS